MLAKVHLKTACGCTRTFFQTVDKVYPAYTIPILINHPWEHPLAAWENKNNTRLFVLVDYKHKSKRRIEMWYEEVFNG
jgi:hypothetical protein